MAEKPCRLVRLFSILRCRRLILPVLLIALSQAGGVVFAEESKDAAASLEMLEFLGEWETDDGEWVDPFALADMTELDVMEDENRDEDQ